MLIPLALAGVIQVSRIVGFLGSVILKLKTLPAVIYNTSPETLIPYASDVAIDPISIGLVGSLISNKTTPLYRVII